MQPLHSPYVSTQYNGQTYNVINFECWHCDQQFGNASLKMAVFLYGVFFLTGKNAQYSGITCPKCLNSILLDITNRSEEFFNTFSLFETPKGKAIVGDLRYYSQASCIAHQKYFLDGFDFSFCAIAFDGTKIMMKHPQNIAFRWTRRNMIETLDPKSKYMWAVAHYRATKYRSRGFTIAGFDAPDQLDVQYLSESRISFLEQHSKIKLTNKPPPPK